MRRRSLLAGTVAAGLSVALHAVVLARFEAPPAAQPTGGAVQLAMIGKSFEDFLMGSATPVAADPVARAETRTEQLQGLHAVDRPAAVEAVDHPGAVTTDAEAPAETAVAATALSVTTTAVPRTQDSSVLPPTAADADAAERAQPVSITAMEVPQVQTPDDSTVRPAAREDRGSLRPPSPPRAEPRQSARQPQGNASQTARSGQQNAAPNGTASNRSNGTGSGAATGTSQAASRYPSEVQRHLRRMRAPRVAGTGTSVIRFTVSGTGGLSAIGIARSSGNPEFDRAAAQSVQRLVPFPSPPPGAQRTFTVTVEKN